MALFNSTTWTGRDAPALAVAERTRMASAPQKIAPRVERDLMSEVSLAEYRKVAAEVGIPAQDLLVEEFRIFLAKHDIPTFNHQEVVAYMDEIAARDNPTKLGWHWCPVRPKDAGIAMTFGRPSRDNRRFSGHEGIEPASDFYESHRFQHWHQHARGGVILASEIAVHTVPSPADWRDMPSPVYTRTIPLHALKKIALIEREFKAGKPVFLVTDYTTAPHVIVNPDPFLMAVIPNSAVAHGKGRFIIDVWDEPGFGIDRMLK